MMRKKENINLKIFLVLAVILTIIFVINKNKEISKLKLEVSDHYNKYVVTNKTATIYINIDGVYKIIGKIAKNQELILSRTVNFNTKYFKIDSKDNYYIYYDDVKKISDPSPKNNRYKKYIPFNEEIVTNNNTSFYDENDNLIYQINRSFTFPIIIKLNDKYGIEYDNQLLYIKRHEIKGIKNNYSKNTNVEGVAVLNYHFFYDANSIIDTNKCNQIICLSTKKLKEHLDYIKENNIFTPTMKELEMYIDKKINLPKSVVITIDDGWRAQMGAEIISQYKLNATVFLITNYINNDIYDSEYIELHSHSNDMHRQGVCNGGQGGGIKCLPRDVILKDLMTSREKLNNTTIFCYPFYEYNNYSIELLKEAGFTMAFGGYKENGYDKITPGADKFRLPRYIIYNNTTVDDIKKYID